MPRRAPKQLALPTPRSWGGRRAGAGRPPKRSRPGVSHVTRPGHDRRHPVHATLRARSGLPSLRSRALAAALRDALAACPRRGFRLIHDSVQTDHLHLVAEADDRQALIRGVHGLAVRCARRINRVARRRGTVWQDRYHARAMTTPRQVRAGLVYHARAMTTPRQVRTGLVYVLLNFRKHLRAAPAIDPGSSGPWFEGWSVAPSRPMDPCPVHRPKTWLASIGWRRAGGAISVAEAPRVQSVGSRARRPSEPLIPGRRRRSGKSRKSEGPLADRTGGRLRT
jgi:REP element-mobilizing transposase RayT